VVAAAVPGHLRQADGAARAARFAGWMHRRVRALSVWGPQVNCQ
jgi:hypothetical protein